MRIVRISMSRHSPSLTTPNRRSQAASVLQDLMLARFACKPVEVCSHCRSPFALWDLWICKMAMLLHCRICHLSECFAWKPVKTHSLCKAHLQICSTHNSMASFATLRACALLAWLRTTSFLSNNFQQVPSSLQTHVKSFSVPHAQ